MAGAKPEAGYGSGRPLVHFAGRKVMVAAHAGLNGRLLRSTLRAHLGTEDSAWNLASA